MATGHEEVLQAVLQLVTAAVPGASVARNATKPSRLAAGGNVVMRDGDAGEPEVMMGPLTYIYTRRVILEVAAFASDAPEAALATMLRPLGVAIEANRTLGGLADWIEPEAPQPDDTDIAGGISLHWVEVGLVVTYGITNPLG